MIRQTKSDVCKYHILMIILIGTISCTRDVGTMDTKGFPHDVGVLFLTRCAVSGCHNYQSKDAASGLCLESWEDLFKGSRNNSSVIPFRPDQSFLLYSINTFPDLGPQLIPSMPLNDDHLTRDEVILIRNWITEGAPNLGGFVKFSDDPGRKKLYVANQGCDMVTVFDLQTKLAMRCIDVGKLPSTESPHDIFVSPDGQYWYVSFYVNNIFQKYRASDDAFVGEVDLGDISWHSLACSPDSRFAIATHLDGNGKIALIDLQTMQLVVRYEGSGLFIWPHGCTFDQSGNFFYVVSLFGNYFYKVDITDPFNPDINMITLQTGDVPNANGIHKPYEIDFSPDYSKYFVTCQGTLEIRVFNAANDSLIAVIPSSGIPQTMAFSTSMPYLFVANMEDSSLITTESTVDVINYNTNQLVQTVYPGYQPRGLAVDDVRKCVFVADRNVTPAGPQPHHTTSCGGKNGYITLIDMYSLQLIPGWRTEVSVDPYSVAIRK